MSDLGDTRVTRNAKKTEELTMSDLAGIIQKSNADIKASIESINNKLHKMNSSIVAVNAKIESFKDEFGSKITELSHRLDNKIDAACGVLHQKVDLNSANLKNHIQTVSELNCKISLLENKLIESDIILNGIPFVRNENLITIFERVCDKINCSLPSSATKSIFRIFNKNIASNTIIIKMDSRNSKVGFLRAFFKYKNLKLCDIGFESDSKIFANESLTTHNSKIHSAARDHLRNSKLGRVLIKRGQVFILRSNFKEGDVPLLVTSMKELDSFIE